MIFSIWRIPARCSEKPWGLSKTTSLRYSTCRENVCEFPMPQWMILESSALNHKNCNFCTILRLEGSQQNGSVARFHLDLASYMMTSPCSRGAPTSSLGGGSVGRSSTCGGRRTRSTNPSCEFGPFLSVMFAPNKNRSTQYPKSLDLWLPLSCEFPPFVSNLGPRKVFHTCISGTFL